MLNFSHAGIANPLAHFGRLCVLLLPLTFIFITGCDALKPTAVETEDFEKFDLEVYPTARAIVDLATAPNGPFVAMNALIFKEQATGEKYTGLTGREAYLLYGEGLIDDQQELNSRLIWSGSVLQQFRGVSDPMFEEIGLLEYSSPNSLLKFMTNAGDAPDARSAGLLGQWNIFAPTLEESGVEPSDAASTDLPSLEEISTLTGLNQQQLELILQHPADTPLYIIELYRFADETGEIFTSYLDALKAAQPNYGGTLVWRGSMEFFILGASSPEFQEMIVSGYPSAEDYLLTLIDDTVLAEQDSLNDGLSLHWAYTSIKGGFDQFFNQE